MSEATNLLKCPHCYSLNVEPVGPKLWQCGDCKKNFPEAVVEEVPTEAKKKGEK